MVTMHGDNKPEPPQLPSRYILVRHNTPIPQTLKLECQLVNSEWLSLTTFLLPSQALVL